MSFIPEILKKLLGKTGETIWMEPPFQCIHLYGRTPNTPGKPKDIPKFDAESWTDMEENKT